MQYVETIDDFTIKSMWWQDAGKQYTASGYGAKIPTRYMVKVNKENRWRRVYCIIYSNCGSLYVIINKERHFFKYDTELEAMRDKYLQSKKED